MRTSSILFFVFFFSFAVLPAAVAASNEPLKTVKAVGKLIKKGVDLNEPRFIEAKDIVDYLEQFENAVSDVDPKFIRAYSYYISPLVETVVFGNREGVELLLKNGAALDRACPLDYRAYKEKGYSLEPIIPYYQFSPLMAAAVKNDASMVELFLRAKADPNFRVEKYQLCALERAIQAEADMSVIKLLVEAGADRLSLTQSLIFAMWAKREDLISYLLQAGANPAGYIPTMLDFPQTPFLYAVWQGNAPRVRQYLAVGADPNQTNIRSYDLVRDLIDHHCIVYNTYANNCWNYGISKTKGYRGGVDSLLREFSVPDPTKIYNPLQIAFMGMNPGGFSAADEKAALNAREAIETLDVLLAARSSQKVIVGADSPLMTAAYYGSLEGIDRLLRAGADWMHSNVNGDMVVDSLIRGICFSPGMSSDKTGAYSAYLLTTFSFPIIDRLIAVGATLDEKKHIARTIIVRAGVAKVQKGDEHVADEIKKYAEERLEYLSTLSER